ncbi:MAG: hypothetical protein CTY15_07505 [Methylocystis sp.]|nr:MAG: hypothetical protein CTY15_07505 [Methylocystis sp.]
MKGVRLFLFGFLAFTAAPSFAAPAVVSGKVFSRERIAPPPGYVLRIELRDISRQDVASEEIAFVEMRPKRPLPVRYKLGYDPARIDPSHMYAVSARGLVDGRLVFISTIINSVITRGRPEATDILVQSVGQLKR